VSPAIPTKVFDTYWYLAAERQAIFFRRIRGEAPDNWTSDPIIKKYKFTNSYRASDRVSQYLIRNVIYKGDQEPAEVFFRTILFKLFNRVETWELLERELGALNYSEYSFERYDQVLGKARTQGARIYSAAYIMPSGNRIFGHREKHRNHLKLLERMMEDEVGLRISDTKSMKQAFEILLSYPLIGNFLAYQYVTDLNYSTLSNFSETEFVLPGPGASEGLRKCFSSLGGLNEANMIHRVMDSQEEEFAERGLDFKTLWGRPLQLIDCQNLFCEVNKYARVAHPEFAIDNGRTRIKQHYRRNDKSINYWYPPKWHINNAIEESFGSTSTGNKTLFGEDE
jgi:hypothetical protein